jgi:hypothetical protein
MKNKTILAVIFATVAISVVAFSRWKSDKQANAAPEGMPLAVRIFVVQSAAITRNLVVSGTLVG